MKIPGDVLLVTIVTFLTGAEGDTSSWLNWSWSQAKTVSKDAGNALYKGVRELACLKVADISDNLDDERFRESFCHLSLSAATLAGGRSTSQDSKSFLTVILWASTWLETSSSAPCAVTTSTPPRPSPWCSASKAGQGEAKPLWRSLSQRASTPRASSATHQNRKYLSSVLS